MLYDPKWEVTKTKPTLAGFIAWLGLQPNKGEKICVNNARDCAVARYFRSLGLVSPATMMAVGDYMGVSAGILYDIVGYEANGTNRTYGEAYEVARKVYG